MKARVLTSKELKINRNVLTPEKPRRKRICLNQPMKYVLTALIVLICCAAFYPWIHSTATVSRGYEAFGGETLLLVALPIIAYPAYVTVRDSIQDLFGK